MPNATLQAPTSRESLCGDVKRCPSWRFIYSKTPEQECHRKVKVAQEVVVMQSAKVLRWYLTSLPPTSARGRSTNQSAPSIYLNKPAKATYKCSSTTTPTLHYPSRIRNSIIITVAVPTSLRLLSPPPLPPHPPPLIHHVRNPPTFPCPLLSRR